MSIRWIVSISAVSLAGVGGLLTSLGGGAISLYTLFSPNVLQNLGFLAMHGFVPLIEFPAFLISLRYRKLGLTILWSLFLLNSAVVVGDVWQCGNRGNCVIPGFWEQLRSSVIWSLYIRLTLITALLAQLGQLLGAPGRRESQVLAEVAK